MSAFKAPHLSGAPHMMPHPSSSSWNAEAMPWTVAPFGGVMEFNAEQLPLDRKFHVHKRKSNEFAPIPSKQFITEEKMAAHMNGLHISSDYVSHSSSAGNDDFKETTEVDMDNSDFGFNVPMTQKELEEKLINASRIIVCDQLKKLNEEDPIIPKALLPRFEKPCTALVLWQPPPKLSGFHEKQEFSVHRDAERVEDDDKDNNNCSNLDLNYTMETDM